MSNSRQQSSTSTNSKYIENKAWILRRTVRYILMESEFICLIFRLYNIGTHIALISSCLFWKSTRELNQQGKYGEQLRRMQQKIMFVSGGCTCLRLTGTGSISVLLVFHANHFHHCSVSRLSPAVYTEQKAGMQWNEQ